MVNCLPPDGETGAVRNDPRRDGSGSPLCQDAAATVGVGSAVSPGSDCSEVLVVGSRSAALSHSQPTTTGRGSTPLMSHTTIVGSQLAGHPAGRLTSSLAGPGAGTSQQVASSATSTFVKDAGA